MAEETGLQTKAIIAATSSGSIKRCSRELGRSDWKNSSSIEFSALPCSWAIRPTKVFMPSEAVGPGSTELTVTPVPIKVQEHKKLR